MFSYEIREIINNLNEDNSISRIKHWVSELNELDKQRVSDGLICCKEIDPTDICFDCFEYQMDRKFLLRLKNIVKAKSKKDK